MKIAITGIGHTKFGVLPQTLDELIKQASLDAIENSHINLNEIDAVYIGNYSSQFAMQGHIAAIVSEQLGLTTEITRVESACASGSLAVKQGILALLSGRYKNILVIGVEKMTNVTIDTATKILSTAASNEEMQHGFTFPSLFALIANAYFDKYQANETHLAKVAVKNHDNALLNPLAHFQKQITVEDVLNSRVIASPLKLLDCSPISDGAAAVILTSEDAIDHSTQKPVYILGMGHVVGPISLFNRSDLCSIPSVVSAAKKAYEMAGITPKDISFAELHDCFTIAELIEMEDLGFCNKGQAKKLIDNDETKRNGKIPINLSGGLKAKGHPVGATGVAQIVEVVKQLRGEAGDRQINKAKYGLTCNLGGVGASALVTILSN